MGWEDAFVLTVGVLTIVLIVYGITTAGNHLLDQRDTPARRLLGRRLVFTAAPESLTQRQRVSSGVVHLVIALVIGAGIFGMIEIATWIHPGTTYEGGPLFVLAAITLFLFAFAIWSGVVGIVRLLQAAFY